MAHESARGVSFANRKTAEGACSGPGLGHVPSTSPFRGRRCGSREGRHGVVEKCALERHLGHGCSPEGLAGSDNSLRAAPTAQPRTRHLDRRQGRSQRPWQRIISRPGLRQQWGRVWTAVPNQSYTRPSGSDTTSQRRRRTVEARHARRAPDWESGAWQGRDPEARRANRKRPQGISREDARPNSGRDAEKLAERECFRAWGQVVGFHA
jgi:hypothetical protein